MSVFTDLYDAHLTIGGHPITWREILGNGFGFASAVGGLRRRVWAWPVGIIGNVLLFTVFVDRDLERRRAGRCSGQAGRQMFFIVVSIYGWCRWQQDQRQRRRTRRPSRRAGRPARERAAYLAAAARRSVLLRRVHASRRRLPGSVVVLPGRRLDLRRLDPRDVRDGPRLGRLLAVLDRGRPGRRAAAAALAASTRPRCCTSSTACFVIWGFVAWLTDRAHRGGRLGDAAPRAGGGARHDAPRRPAGHVERAIDDIAAGKAVVVVDDEDRENEGDLIFAASQGDARAAGVHDPLHLRRGLRADGGRRRSTGSASR